jgi:Flp pilus assembly protein TadB
MQRRFISVRASDVGPAKLSTVCFSYFAYEHARLMRKLLCRRLAMLVVGTTVLTWGVHLFPEPALAATVGIATACMAVVVRVEWSARRRFIDELRDVPSAGLSNSR